MQNIFQSQSKPAQENLEKKIVVPKAHLNIVQAVDSRPAPIEQTIVTDNPNDSALKKQYTIKKEYLDSLKIGAIVKIELRKILEKNLISADEVEKMQTESYSKKTFGINYPLLLAASKAGGQKPTRYYAQPLYINELKYFLCSEWFEVPANNDRPFLYRWFMLNDFIE